MDKEKLFENYKGKKVLVTGADGFMGSHLVDRLLELGADVSIFVRGTSTVGTSKNNFKNLSHTSDVFSNILTGNIASSDSVELIKSIKPEIVFHLAAEAYVPRCFEQPLEVFDVNLTGTLNVLEAARALKDIERVVVTSSSEIYGSYDNPISELNLLNPTSPYGASKAAADRAAYSWYFTYHLPIAIMRPFNTYGPRHTYDVIPKFIDLALLGKPITVHGSGEQSRDFTYVSDTVEGFLVMGIHQKAIGEAVNFGASHGVSIKYIAEKIVDATKSSSAIIHTEARLAEVGTLTSDCSKAKELFGWEPKVSIEDGLKENIAWMQKNR
jgi:nucleoside-diphosphate-sugar epimerase